MEKKLLRKKYMSLRNTLSFDEIEDKSLSIANQTLKLPIWNKTNYHIFLSIIKKKEINSEYLLHILQGKDKSVIVSQADFASQEMRHILLQENTKIEVSDYGIPEPVSGIAITPSAIDVVFIPLLAFDENGNRIGYGKGFYDRFLQKCHKKTLKIGLSFFEAETVSISVNKLDIAMDYCVTPSKVYTYKQNIN